MRRIVIPAAVVVAAITLAGMFGLAAAQQTQNPAQNPRSQCCGMSPWPMGHGMMNSGGKV